MRGVRLLLQPAVNLRSLAELYPVPRMSWLKAEDWERVRARGKNRYLLTASLPVAVGLTIGKFLFHLVGGLNLPPGATPVSYLFRLGGTFFIAYITGALAAMISWRANERRFAARPDRAMHRTRD